VVRNAIRLVTSVDSAEGRFNKKGIKLTLGTLLSWFYDTNVLSCKFQAFKASSDSLVRSASLVLEVSANAAREHALHKTTSKT
jgi:hypothetical protein